ncbi:hypothetical protein HY008_02205 [Candidatus Woesebacteria bacterium]|nr:hypothetical protein [Candidatus Woesebacteria bacterium]
MEKIQSLLIIVIVSLTILLMAIGIQVFLTILDLRRTVKRLNSILEDAILGGGLIKPEKITGILEIIKKKRPSEIQEKGNI